MLDDDMDTTAVDVEQLVAMSRKLSRPCSMTYTTGDGSLCHAKIEGSNLWLSGLGVLAIPRAMILELRKESAVFINGTRRAVAFTEARMRGRVWSSEDYTLTNRLGGVVLVPIRAGHLKVQSMHPNDLQIDAVAHQFSEYCNAKL